MSSSRAFCFNVMCCTFRLTAPQQYEFFLRIKNNLQMIGNFCTFEEFDDGVGVAEQVDAE